MLKSDVSCSECGAGFRRVELSSIPSRMTEFRCGVCDNLIEVLDGTAGVEYRLTVQPSLNALVRGTAD
jgi:hypothetical protein